MSGFGASGRHEHISAVLRKEGRISVSDLAATLRVSVVTVRNDLEALERQGVLRRIRGGAVMVRTARFERPSHLAAESFSAEKARISAVAASLIRDGETVIIDAGSTMVALARALPRTLNDVAVVTNALDVALELEEHPGVRVAVTGGTMRGRQRSLVAPFATQLLSQINADVAFLSCAGFHPEKGFTQSNWEEAEVKHAMLAAAGRSVVLADHGKFGHVGTARIAPIARVDMLVSDSGLSAEAVRALEERGPRIVLA
ncbi:DeoR/GlpR family DNA-binding transcription regulator [Lichenihabitans sp. Uapishka_5]|uniref:DeoR/GlpR family DNA-binding transcription regulator n=1 Tax=Lichenihabitans sp. Uapishka_5 TaxID=3037302 RepID=UPI0029E80022|nr:DeoR/GlpR family DNA-binding transcription regulator [Lichenihabitans sp. Uapishka_5]MDX7951283.1 DeoR/GlpR family DNA-binding transcription regulator [Lichenihabitans sp. Uapishka_5]